MATSKLKITRIGNSRGVRLPADTLRRYHMGDEVLMEVLAEGILIRPLGPAVEKLSWEDTAKAMAATREDWGDWDAVATDGLSEIPWDRATKVADRSANSPKRGRPARRAASGSA